MDHQSLSRLTVRLNDYTDDVIQLQKKLTAIPAIGPENQGQGEFEKAKLILSLLKDFKISTANWFKGCSIFTPYLSVFGGL